MGKLTIQEVAKILTEKNGLSPREASNFAAEMFSVILQHLQEGDAVKVKGLGTFKIINVEARESVSVRTGERVVIDSHSKVTFTPDTIMRELVNKPFSQFETVVLNDGVEFEDIKDDEAEEEATVTKEPTVTEEPAAVEEPAIVEEPVVAEEPVAVEEPVVVEEQPAETEEEPVVDEEPTVEEEPVADEEPAVEEEPAELINFYEEEEEPERHWGRWLLGGFVVLLLIAGAGYGGYELGRQQQPTVVTDTVHVRDTVYVTKKDSVESQPVKLLPEPTSAPVPEPKLTPERKQETADPYAAKDERVRLGAYRIVGLSHEVTVLEGQTFYSICRAHLGPDMQCYVEAYNNLPRNPQIKVGQVLKIPKLELKKRR
jgi:nucleoid DNA-binding protein